MNTELALLKDNFLGKEEVAKKPFFLFLLSTFVTKKKLIILAIIGILIILSVSLVLMVHSFYISNDNLQVNPVDNSVSNKSIVISSNLSPVFIDFNDKTYFSNSDKSPFVVDMGKIEGSSMFKVGPYSNFYGNKVKGSKTQIVNVQRDYSAPKITSDIPKSSLDNEIKFIINVESNSRDNIKNTTIMVDQNESFVLSPNKDLNYNGFSCKISTSSNYACTINFDKSLDNDTKEISLRAKDGVGNVSDVQVFKTKKIAKLAINCDEEEATSKGNLNCKVSKKVDLKIKITNNDKNFDQEVSPEKPLLIEKALSNGAQSVEFTYEDADKNKEIIVKKYEVDTDPLSIRVSRSDYRSCFADLSKNKYCYDLNINSNKNINITNWVEKERSNVYSYPLAVKDRVINRSSKNNTSYPKGLSIIAQDVFNDGLRTRNFYKEEAEDPSKVVHDYITTFDVVQASGNQKGKTIKIRCDIDMICSKI